MSQFCVCDCVVRMLLQNDEWIKAVFAIQCTANKPLIVCNTHGISALTRQILTGWNGGSHRQTHAGQVFILPKTNPKLNQRLTFTHGQVAVKL